MNVIFEGWFLVADSQSCVTSSASLFYSKSHNGGCCRVIKTFINSNGSNSLDSLCGEPKCVWAISVPSEQDGPLARAARVHSTEIIICKNFKIIPKDPWSWSGPIRSDPVHDPKVFKQVRDPKILCNDPKIPRSDPSVQSKKS